jgi:hypothetical protein
MDAPLFAEGRISNSGFSDHLLFVETEMQGLGFRVTERWGNGNGHLAGESSRFVTGAKSLAGFLYHSGHEVEWKVFKDELLMPHLVARERLLHSSMVRLSRERLEVLLDPEFSEVGASGERYSREEIVSLLINSREEVEILSDDFEMQRLGPSVAMLLYRSWQLSQNGKKMREAMRSSIWVCSLGQWALVFHQGTLCQESGNAT